MFDEDKLCSTMLVFNLVLKATVCENRLSTKRLNIFDCELNICASKFTEVNLRAEIFYVMRFENSKKGNF